MLPALRRSGTRLLAGILIVSVTACGWKITPPPGSKLPAAASPVAEAVLLEVNDGAVIWGRGELGATLKQALQEKGAFHAVHYPVVPREPPPQRLTVTAKGGIDEEVGLGIVKSMIIGVLMFIPVGIIRFNRDFTLDAEVAYREAGREVRRFAVQSKTGVSHTMFSDTDEYEPAARKAAFGHLAQRIAEELAGTP